MSGQMLYSSGGHHPHGGSAGGGVPKDVDQSPRRTVSPSSQDEFSPDGGRNLTRKEKNRQAAARSRRRKQHRLKELEDTLEAQRHDITQLKTQLTSVFQEIHELEQQQAGGAGAAAAAVVAPDNVASGPDEASESTLGLD